MVWQVAHKGSLRDGGNHDGRREEATRLRARVGVVVE